MQMTSTETRRAAACRAFWSDHPLNLAFRETRQVEAFSLKDFVAFVVALDADTFEACTREVRP